MYWWYGHMMGGWGYSLLTFIAIALWVLVALVAVALFRHVEPGVRAPWSSAERVLSERFARGEIDEDEYRTRLAVLRGRTAPPQAGPRAWPGSGAGGDAKSGPGSGSGPGPG
ncbi:SHOCT domain-containing protein [Streptomyces sp. NPDC097640]|uniref:SHOCT domain-containing protein n=1 Tax=Streptomyces sp. NPDC097640 TaxID=3157229 RepID=UPI0033336F68